MKSDIRDIFFNNVKQKFLSNKNIYIITNDVDVHSLKVLRKNKRFIDVGVAEQNMMNIAAGISKKKNLAIVYGFCNFVTLRCYEQLKFSIASHNCNTKIIGIGPGFSFSNDGPTHHGVQDLYSMYLIPEFEIFNISDGQLANEISSKINVIKGPCYIRIDKGNFNFENKINYSLKKGFNYLQKAKKKNILIITTGYFCFNALEISKKFEDVSVINFFRMKKFDSRMFCNELKKYNKILIYDENTFSGGISPIITNFLFKKKIFKRIEFLVCPDKQLFEYSHNRDKLLDVIGLSKKKLEKIIFRSSGKKIF
tara:strand:- start:33887 stop:34816 length:930 start_codon:yes stop_codon:yes gene_type:complete